MGGRHSHPKHKSPPPSKQQQHQAHQLQLIHQQHQSTPPIHRDLPDVDSPRRLACLETDARGNSPGVVTPHSQEERGSTRPQRPKTLQPLSFNKSKVFSQHRYGPSSKSRCFPTLNKNVCYNSHASQTSSWLPPLENWSPGGAGLPYGWETAVDKEGRTYFINHLNKTTSYEDPRKDFQEDPPSPRQIELTRDPDMGFGFVAGSEKPVIVRFVTDGGPSVDKLLPGDQILMINGEDVKKAPRDHVIQLVRSCKESVTLTVCQPPLDNSARKSALLSAAKKQRLKHNPSRVRFAESVDINGATSLSPSQISSSESTTPFMPNVLKVFLENGQTKSFKYDTSTTVADVLDSLHQKLGIKCQEHFSLVVEHVKSLRRNKLTLLDPRETLTKIAAQPGAQHLRCLYRITFVPRDAYDMLRKDSVAFEYLFLQCCNDVIQERFSPELKYDVALRLAALHIHQHALSSSSTNAKISLKTIERECGLDRFVPASLVESMKRKELRKLLSHFLKLHGGLAAPGQKQMTALQAKLHYLKIISELPSYGAKCFSTNVMEGNVESVMLISPRFGISQISGIRNSMPEPICEIEQVISVAASREDDLSMRVEISLKHPDKENLVVSLDDRDAEELILVLQGYYKLLTEKSLAVSYAKETISKEQGSAMAPPYHSCHLVQSSPWSYLNANEEDNRRGPKVADFSLAPPYQHLPEGYKIPNGNIPRITDSEIANSYGSCLRMPLLDSNMNKTLSVYENAGDSPLLPTGFTTSSATGAAGPEKPFLESSEDVAPPPTQSPSSDVPQRGATKEANEARNPEVLNHVMEMRQMVEDAETYLSDPEGEVTDAESVRSESYGKLKHSDSLLLLTQGQKLVAKVDVLENEERSESDTDSQSTPQSSPAHKPTGSSSPPLRPSSIVKTSGSSFGLHSPDNLPMNFENPDSNIKALIRQLEDNSGLPYTFAEGTLYLDPDIIDLTMIPPPITPDEDGARMLPSQLSTPPTPFADRESLDQELKALERDVGDLRALTNTSWVEGASLQSLSESSNAGTSDTDDTLSLSSVSTVGNDSVRRASSLASLMKRNGSTGGPGFTLAALRQLGINIGEGEDIDSFIANLTIPPPPEGSVAFQNYKDERKMGGEYDINAYIIPPPPSSAASDNRSSDIIRRLYEAKEGISRVVGNSETESAEKDNDVDELRITSEQLSRSPIQAGRVASLQKHFENPFGPPSSLRGNENLSPEMKHKALKYNKNKLNLVKELAGHNNFRMNNIKVPREMDIRLAEALAENDKVFKSFNSPLKYHGNVPPGVENSCDFPGNKTNSSPITSRVRAYGGGHFPPNHNNSSGDESIRKESHHHHSIQQNHQQSPNHHLNLLFARRESEGILSTTSSGDRERHHGGVFQRSNTIEGETVSYNKNGTGTLSKSASHGDIAIHGQTTANKLFSSPIKHTKSSISNEDLRPGNWHYDSEGKQSVASSNDSLTSSSSVATVKSVKSLEREEDDPPELPPRSGAKVNLKPPLPRNSSQDGAKGLPIVKGIRSPSPIRKPYGGTPSEIGADKPPAVPCRTKKTSSPTNTLPLPQKNSTTLQRNLASSKPLPVKSQEGTGIDFHPATRNSTLPKKLTTREEEEKPALPSKTVQAQAKKHLTPVSVKSPKPILSPPRQQPLVNNGVSLKNNYNHDPPLHTSSPKLPPKMKIANGKSNDLNDSLDSGSFDQDSLEETEDVEAMLPASKEAYRHTASVVSDSLKKLTDIIAICSKYQEDGDNPSKDEEQFQRFKDSLTSESRQFVTASKLFVKSATESEEVLLNSLSKCVTILQKMVELSQLVVKATSTPSQTQTVVLKVRDVTNAYLSTVRAALSASGRGMDHPSMNTLMGQATSLAGVLTALMRTLKVFTP